MRARSTLIVALATVLSSAAPVLAQQSPAPPRASGPPIPITPPASVYTHVVPSASPSAPPTVATLHTVTSGAATATTAAVIVHVPDAAKPDCGPQLVVWANPATHIYHFSTSEYYGHTKVGSYVRESDAKAQGMRPGRTEVRP